MAIAKDAQIIPSQTIGQCLFLVWCRNYLGAAYACDVVLYRRDRYMNALTPTNSVFCVAQP